MAGPIQDLLKLKEESERYITVTYDQITKALNDYTQEARRE